MPLSEDKRFSNDHSIIQHFEKMLMELLERHTDYQKQILQLTEENKALKELLKASKATFSSSANKGFLLDNAVVDQINGYIKEIDLCLAYFEQA